MAVIAVRYGHADEAAGRALAEHLDVGGAAPQDLTHDELMGQARADIAHRAEAADVVVYVWSAKSDIVDDLAQRDRDVLVAGLASGNLIFAKVDDAALPLGFRDLPAERIDAGDPTSFDRLGRQAALRIKTAGRVAPEPAVEVRSRSVGPPSKPPPGPEAAPVAERRGGGGLAGLAVAVVLGGGAAAAAWFFGLQGRLAAADVAGTGDRIGALPGWAFLTAAGAAAVVAAALAAGLIAAAASSGRPPVRRKSARRNAAAEAEAAEPLAGDIVFVSYARRDSAQVDAVAEDLAALGFDVWMDRADMHGGAGWAGQIVGAIRESKAQVVMCSAAAFQSDHVAREIYLADHFKKPLLPVFLEQTDPPDELLYFLVRPQRIFVDGADADTRRSRIAEAMAAL